MIFRPRVCVISSYFNGIFPDSQFNCFAISMCFFSRPSPGAEHGAQLLRPDPLRDILPSQPPPEAQHEGERTHVVTHRFVRSTKKNIFYLWEINVDLIRFPDIGTWQTVVELNFGTNKIGKLPDDIACLANLEVKK